jgi:hypothetical protein
MDAARDSEIPIQPGIEQRATIDFDTPLAVPVRGLGGPRLETQTGTVGVCDGDVKGQRAFRGEACWNSHRCDGTTTPNDEGAASGF